MSKLIKTASRIIRNNPIEKIIPNAEDIRLLHAALKNKAEDELMNTVRPIKMQELERLRKITQDNITRWDYRLRLVEQNLLNLEDFIPQVTDGEWWATAGYPVGYSATFHCKSKQSLEKAAIQNIDDYMMLVNKKVNGKITPKEEKELESLHEILLMRLYQSGVIK